MGYGIPEYISGGWSQRKDENGKSINTILLKKNIPFTDEDGFQDFETQTIEVDCEKLWSFLCSVPLDLMGGKLSIQK